MERIHLTLSDEEINASIPLKPEQPVNSRITVPSEATKPEVGMIWYKKINHCSWILFPWLVNEKKDAFSFARICAIFDLP